MNWMMFKVYTNMNILVEKAFKLNITTYFLNVSKESKDMGGIIFNCVVYFWPAFMWWYLQLMIMFVMSAWPSGTCWFRCNVEKLFCVISHGDCIDIGDPRTGDCEEVDSTALNFDTFWIFSFARRFPLFCGNASIWMALLGSFKWEFFGISTIGGSPTVSFRVDRSLWETFSKEPNTCSRQLSMTLFWFVLMSIFGLFSNFFSAPFFSSFFFGVFSFSSSELLWDANGTALLQDEELLLFRRFGIFSIALIPFFVVLMRTLSDSFFFSLSLSDKVRSTNFNLNFNSNDKNLKNLLELSVLDKSIPNVMMSPRSSLKNSFLLIRTWFT